MPRLASITDPPPSHPATPVPRGASLSRTALRLAIVTLAWKVAELSLSAYAAWTAHSPAMLAFGSDTVVELISATLVLAQAAGHRRLTERRAARLAGVLLVLLSVVVIGASLGSLVLHIEPDKSRLGIAVTLAAVAGMPLLASRKRREALRIHNGALAADAVQSATCAFLALVTLAGLGINALFGVPWVDNLAALLAVPLLLREARLAFRGHFCDHC